MSPVRRWARTPKGVLTLVLLAFTVIAGRVVGPGLVAAGVVATVAVAVAVDLPLQRWRRGRWIAPTGAVLTGLLVAMIVSPRESAAVAAGAAGLAIAGKHVLRLRGSHVLNPAAAGLVAVYYLVDPGQDWWGALPSIEPVAATLLLIGAGAFVADRVHRVPLVLSFLATFFIVVTVVAFAGDPTSVADVFAPPDLYAVLFCSGFMLTDPPTSPTGVRWQVACGVTSAAAALAVYFWLGAAHYLLSGVLAGNLVTGASRLARRRAARPATSMHPATHAVSHRLF